jgi:hypothetical protein
VPQRFPLAAVLEEEWEAELSLPGSERTRFIGRWRWQLVHPFL